MKALLGYGARMPKELMLFVKNMVFLDGAIASLAPDLDLFAEIAHISMYFAETHGERIAADVGIDPDSFELDLTGIKGSFGVDPDDTEQPHLPRPAGAPRRSSASACRTSPRRRR